VVVSGLPGEGAFGGVRWVPVGGRQGRAGGGVGCLSVSLCSGLRRADCAAFLSDRARARNRQFRRLEGESHFVR
jgi:hypothetical protein